MEELQNLAGKIEEVKEKLTDAEYKDLLELSHKYYDKEQERKEKEKKKKFVKVMCIKSTMTLDLTAQVDHADCDCGDCNDNIYDLLDSTTDTARQYDYNEHCDEYHGNLKQLRLKGGVKQTNQTILFEITTRDAISGFCIDMNICKMTDYAYDILLKDKYMINEGHNFLHPDPTTFVYLSHFEV
jgi:RNA processing factor Prp31